MMEPRKQPLSPLDLPEVSDVVSSTECTGLIPALPATREGLEARLKLFSNALPPDPPEDK